MGFIYISSEFAEQVKNLVKRGKDRWDLLRYELRYQADKARTLGPWSVTFYESPVPSGDPHDYYSEAPYWWPDPQNPDGPYIRRDGEFWPDRFTAHHKAFGELAKNVLLLTLAGYYLDEKVYRDRAIELIRVWFLDPETKMNPNVEYGEAIKNVCQGRSAGIIVLRNLDEIIHAMTYLEEFPEYRMEIGQFKEWVRKMLHWLTTSPLGIGESQSGNNHAVWWANHVAACAAFTGNDYEVNRMFELYRMKFLTELMAADGSLPRELERTRSFHYSLYCLDAMTLLCEMAYYRGIDLWHYTTPNGQCIEKGIRFIMPFFNNPYLWKYPQIDGEVPDERVCLQWGGLRLGISDCATINWKRSRLRYLIRNHHPLGPTVFLPGHFIMEPS